MVVHLLSPSGSGTITLCGEHDRTDAGIRLTSVVDNVTCPHCRRQWADLIEAHRTPTTTRNQTDER